MQCTKLSPFGKYYVKHAMILVHILSAISAKEASHPSPVALWQSRLLIMPKNHAAWIPAEGRPLQVGEARYNLPGPKDIIIKSCAVVIDPIE